MERIAVGGPREGGQTDRLLPGPGCGRPHRRRGRPPLPSDPGQRQDERAKGRATSHPDQLGVAAVEERTRRSPGRGSVRADQGDDRRPARRRPRGPEVAVIANRPQARAASLHPLAGPPARNQARQRGTLDFVSETRRQVVNFYGDLVENLRDWQAKAPRLPTSETPEEGDDPRHTVVPYEQAAAQEQAPTSTTV